ncbi:MAG: hypothetical protein MUC50_22825, partial [Myxococcota bacterium]|nr:hypothetical protein [Myxococcota bacterium]
MKRMLGWLWVVVMVSLLGCGDRESEFVPAEAIPETAFDLSEVEQALTSGLCLMSAVVPALRCVHKKAANDYIAYFGYTSEVFDLKPTSQKQNEEREKRWNRPRRDEAGIP